MESSSSGPKRRADDGPVPRFSPELPSTSEPPAQKKARGNAATRQRQQAAKGSGLSRKQRAALNRNAFADAVLTGMGATSAYLARIPSAFKVNKPNPSPLPSSLPPPPSLPTTPPFPSTSTSSSTPDPSRRSTRASQPKPPPASAPPKPKPEPVSRHTTTLCPPKATYLGQIPPADFVPASCDTEPFFKEVHHRDFSTLGLKSTGTIKEEDIPGPIIRHTVGHGIYWTREVVDGKEVARIVLTVLTIRLADATDEDKERFKDLTYALQHLFNGSNKNCNTNGGWLKGGKYGYMVGDGWRFCYRAGLGALGTYARSKVQYKYEEMTAFRQMLPLLNDAAFYYFKKNHPIALAVNAKLLKKMKIPSFGQTTSLRAALLDPRGFAANLTASYGRFGNSPHRDNDEEDFVTSGFWYTVYDGLPVTTADYHAGRLKNLRGGNLWLPEYSLIVDFSDTAGMTFVTWNGWKDLHCTTLCEGDQLMDRIGVSMQVGTRTSRGCERYASELERLSGREAAMEELVEKFEAAVTVGNDVEAPAELGEVEVTSFAGRGRVSRRIAKMEPEA